MTIDTLAYVKTLEAAGFDQKAAEAITRHVLPDLATKTDLQQAVARLERKIEVEIERSEHRVTLRVIAVVGAFDAALFALLRFMH